MISLLLKDEHAAGSINGKEINGPIPLAQMPSDAFLREEHLWQSQCHLVQIRTGPKLS